MTGRILLIIIWNTMMNQPTNGNVHLPCHNLIKLDINPMERNCSSQKICQIADTFCTQSNQRSLNGSNLKIGVIQSGAYMKFLNVTSSGQVLDAKGFIKDLLNILSWRMGFKFQMIAIKGHGKELTPGYWTGAIQALIDSDVDLVAADMSMTPRRKQFVDFSGPYAQDLHRIYVSVNQSYVVINWKLYLQPLDWPVWLFVVGAVFIITSCMALTNFLYKPFVAAENDGKDTGGIPSTRVEYPPWASIYWEVWAIFIQQGMSYEPSCNSGKIFLCVASLMSMIVFNCYTSMLISVTTVAQKPGIVQTVSDVLHQPRYQIGLLTDTILQEKFQDELSKATLTRIHKFGTGNISSFQEGLDMMYTKDIALISVESEFNSNTKGNCSFLTLQDIIYRESYHFAFPKNSNLTRMFTHILNQLQQNGALDSLAERNSMTQISRGCTNENANTVSPVNLPTIAGAFLAIIVGTGAAILLFFIEKFTRMCRPVQPLFISKTLTIYPESVAKKNNLVEKLRY